MLFMYPLLVISFKYFLPFNRSSLLTVSFAVQNLIRSYLFIFAFISFVEEPF